MTSAVLKEMKKMCKMTLCYVQTLKNMCTKK